MNEGEPECGVVLFVGGGPGSPESVTEAGFEVECAADAAAAVDRADEGRVDCVVVQHDPPAVDGVALADRLAGHRPGLPVALHPTDGSESLASAAVAAGVAAYVPSDGGPERLVSAIERVTATPGERIDYREVFRQVDAGLTVRDTETGELLDVNEHYCDLLGYSREEAMALGPEEITADVPGYDAERRRELIGRSLEEPSFAFEWPDETKDGEVVWVEVDATVAPIDGRDRLLVTVRDVSDRRERERVLETLHGAAARIGQCETVEAACEATVEAASGVLDLGMCAVFVVEGEWLVPRAVSSDAPESGTRRMRTDQGIAGVTFRTGESRLVDDVTTDREADPADDRYRSGISVPVGETAVFQAVAAEPGAFDAIDVEMAELLVAHTARALDRIRYEAELERQNERLDEFAGVVSHDLRNPLNVAQARLEMARDEVESPHLETANGALSRMADIIDDTLTLARQGRAAVAPESVDLATFARRCWGHVETGDADLETEESFTLRADPDRLRSLFENLFRNSVDHRATDGRPGAGSVPEEGRDDSGTMPTVSVGPLGRRGFYVADDGPGIPAELRDRVFEAGYTTSRDGTGFGLAIVKEVVDAHGWAVSVTESETGGARFEITGVESAD